MISARLHGSVYLYLCFNWAMVPCQSGAFGYANIVQMEMIEDNEDPADLPEILEREREQSAGIENVRIIGPIPMFLDCSFHV